jgi:hypothetical protein
MHWQVDEMASWWNGKVMKWQVDYMASWWHGKLMKRKVGEMASWWNDKLTKWPGTKVSEESLKISQTKLPLDETNLRKLNKITKINL